MCPVLSNAPRFSAYVASKAALDAFSLCAAPEFAAENIDFTTIHMPLVRTPMIAPTGLYKAFPTLSPEQARDLGLDEGVGATIAKVTSGSPAEHAGLQVDDVLVAVADRPVETFKTLFS